MSPTTSSDPLAPVRPYMNTLRDIAGRPRRTREISAAECMAAREAAQQMRARLEEVEPGLRPGLAQGLTTLEGNLARMITELG